MYDRTPYIWVNLEYLFVKEEVDPTISPTTPMAYPAASPVKPTERPAAKCRKPLRTFDLARYHHTLNINTIQRTCTGRISYPAVGG